MLVAACADKKRGGTTNDNTGHTEWPDGRVHHSGFTTVLTPNTKVPVTYNGIVFQETDYNSRQEGNSATAATFAAITARSYHGNLVNVGMMDGSVRSVSDGIGLSTWRALGTRVGGEVVGNDW
jgi:prepilin-type processing-associated H-X9-DG protein